jgi:hypothetical protein
MIRAKMGGLGALLAGLDPLSIGPGAFQAGLWQGKLDYRGGPMDSMGWTPLLGLVKNTSFSSIPYRAKKLAPPLA